ncbi:sulfatase [Seonamhaeicola sp.]|uniref:sulfatase n=1 Tax=Seonamhaeicola sp. TaxID=1912245 RepID=UPI00263A2893|nr:sulfatase [Seonamhaeicola sp.]
MEYLKYILLINLYLLLIGCQSNKNEEKTSGKPNVLFILADDLGYKDLSAMGSEFYETPNIDKLANEGLIFTQAYSASRICSPSRASILTGQFTARHGITDWIGARSGLAWRKNNRHDKMIPAFYAHNLASDFLTLPEALKEEGYNTFIAGKWHLGQEGSLPKDHGFDIETGRLRAGSSSKQFYYAPFDNFHLNKRKKGDKLSSRLAEETIQFMIENQDSPFFAFLSFYAVHAPIQTTEKKWKKYRDKAEKSGFAKVGFEMGENLPIRKYQDNPVYAGLVESMDDAVGQLLKSLKELDLEENTIVIFMSDNGGVVSGDNYSTSNIPLKGGKGTQWEGGIRVPLIIKVPGRHVEGQSNLQVVSTDLYPTILDLIGADLRPNNHLDGISLAPLLGGRRIDSKRPFYWHYPHYGNQGGNPSSIIIEGDWKLIHYWEDGKNELYNIAADIDEQENLSFKYNDKMENMSRKLMTWLEKANAKLPIPDKKYNERLAMQRKDSILNQVLPNLERQRKDYLRPDWQPNADWWGSKVID